MREDKVLAFFEKFLFQRKIKKTFYRGDVRDPNIAIARKTQAGLDPGFTLAKGINSV